MQLHYLIPEQQSGSEKDLDHHIVAETTEDAEDWFVESKDRMLDVLKWEKYSPVFGASFHLRDSHGKDVNRRAHKGDHICIDITEAKGAKKEEFDWVIIDAMEYDDFPDEDRESFALRLKPSVIPKQTKDRSADEFFNRNASSTLVVERSGKQLSAYYHGRNELISSDTVKTQGNAWLGMSTDQWTDLLKGLIE